MFRSGIFVASLVVGIGALTPATFGADRADLCEKGFARWARPSLIPRHTGPDKLEGYKVTDLGRLRNASRIILPNRPEIARRFFSALPDGEYIYVIDDQNRVGIMKRAIGPARGEEFVPSGAFVGSHHGLTQVFADRFGAEPAIIGAGEFFVRAGQVSVFTNQAGTFRGGVEHLQYAHALLEKEGLRFRKGAREIDFSKSPEDPHEKVPKQVWLDLQYRRYPELRNLLKTAREAFAKFERHFPDEATLMKAMNDPATPKETRDILYMAWRNYGRWLQGLESEAFHLDYFTRNEYARRDFLRTLQFMQSLR